jgi:protein-tyrosine kinase
MGKFSDVLEKLAERERLEDSTETLPSPITTQQEEIDESSTVVPLDTNSESDPVPADDQEPLYTEDTIPLQTDEEQTDELSTVVPLDLNSESGPVSTDDQEPLYIEDTIPLQTDEEQADEFSTVVPLDLNSESDPVPADNPEYLPTDDTILLEAEQEDTDEVSTNEQLDSMPVSDPVRAGDPNIFFSDETVALGAEQEETDDASTSVQLDSEAIRLTQVWPFVAYDPAPAESKKKGKEEAETSSKDESTPVSKVVHQVDANLVVYHDPASVEAEIFKVLRTNILFPKDGTPPPSVMVTSALPGDGKSFIASNLAVSIAQGIEEYVLLMDCDMRRSTIHKIFGFDDNISGLSEYLSKDVPLTSLLRRTVTKKLTILPGGRTPNNPSELLSSQRMKDLLEETKKRYKDRFIIVDSPPPHLTAETTALAKYVDGIVLVVRSGRTPKPLVEALIEKIGREKIIGVVLNGHQMPATERYGYGRYNLHNYEYRNDKD